MKNAPAGPLPAGANSFSNLAGTENNQFDEELPNVAGNTIISASRDFEQELLFTNYTFVS